MDLPGVEPGIHPCHGCVLPLYYRPDMRLGGIGPPPSRWQRDVLPLNDNRFFNIFLFYTNFLKINDFKLGKPDFPSEFLVIYF